VIAMTFAIRWSKQAERFLAKLPREIARRVVNKVNSIKDNPYHYLEHYEDADFYKLRVGTYRLLVDVDMTEKVISVRILDHRRNIYQRRN
jgi:mRNA interferase RelE/StbE